MAEKLPSRTAQRNQSKPGEVVRNIRSEQKTEKTGKLALGWSIML